MKRNRTSRPLRLATFIGVMALCLGCFLWGALTVQYRIFPMQPWQQLKAWLRAPIATPPTTAKSPYWLDTERIFAQSGLRTQNVFVGDSMTADGQWSDLLATKEVANRGIRGDTAAMLLDRLGSVTKVEAKTIFLMIGINDFFRGASVDEVAQNYRRIIDVVAVDASTVVLQSTLQVDCTRLSDRFPVVADCRQLNDKVTALNTRLPQWTNATVKYVDINARLTDDHRLLSEFTTDGLHLNSAGYLIWAQVVRPWLATSADSGQNNDPPGQ